MGAIPVGDDDTRVAGIALDVKGREQEEQSSRDKTSRDTLIYREVGSTQS